ncbi:hypothetical protein PHISCL_02919 [Aspergillus sclerotialis]|uniref:Uncharacterized protein n=1 Tax=Aspergillus sclerotialis TaxID=2070753 RepID=A0A3A2ZZH0_9EURO|nr:hypothetical protein PHISCL_02919 [Aspergillus sclerotialis]
MTGIPDGDIENLVLKNVVALEDYRGMVARGIGPGAVAWTKAELQKKDAQCHQSQAKHATQLEDLYRGKMLLRQVIHIVLPTVPMVGEGKRAMLQRKLEIVA